MIRIVRLGSDRAPGEGLRIGTVRRPPRGVPKDQFSARNFYDVWLPTLAPSEPLVKAALSAAADDERAWKQFTKQYRSEMKQPSARHMLDLLAALSRETDFSLGCYCGNENRCHRSILRELMIERGAAILDFRP